MNFRDSLAKLRTRFESGPVLFRLLAPFAAGSFTVLAMPPWSLWIALFIGFSALYVLLSWTNTKRAAFWCGWFFGFGFFVFGLSWISRALTVDGSTFLWVIPLAICGLPALLAVFTGLSTLAVCKLTNLAKLPGLIAFAGSVTLFEWLRGHVFTGFPWNLYGYGWSGVPEMEQSVSLVGIYGLTLFTILWASLPGFLLLWQAERPKRIACAVIIYALPVALCFWGHARLAANPTIFNKNYILRIVQPSIPQSLKWNRQKTIESFNKTLAASKAGNFTAPAGATILMIWPETAVEQGVMQDPGAQNLLKEIFSHYPDNFYLATGLLRWETHGDHTTYYNSIGVYDKQLNLLETYDKSHLVPFGEYIPFSRWLPVNPVVQLDGLEEGPGAATIAIPPTPKSPFQISPMICYEVIFPGTLVQKDTEPRLFLNVTNDGWYGDSAGLRQHLAIARFRSIEEGVPMARAANTGISAIIDAYGRILWKTKVFEVTASNIALPATAAAPTLYSRTGDIPALLLTGFFCIAGFFSRPSGLNKIRTT